MVIDDGSDKFALLARDTTGTNQNFILEAILNANGNTQTAFVLRDDSGNNLNPNLPIPYNQWYEVEIEVTTMDPLDNFNSTMDIGKLFAHSPNMEVEWFSINGNHFPLNEGSGNTLDSNTAVQGFLSGPSGSHVWAIINPTDDGALHITANNGTIGLTKQLPNNRVTPFDYGAINNESVTDFVNDSTAAIQSAIDSGYDVDIPPSRLYITEPLKIRSAVQIRMHGSFMPMSDSGHEITISDEANTTTILYSDKNIDYIIIQSRNVEIYNGLLYTFGSVDHSKAAILFDIEFPIWRTDIVGVNVYGNQSYLLDPDKIGTTAFKIDCENLNNSGYLTEGHIDGRAYWCHKGVEITPLDPTSTAYVNNIDFTVTGFGCQVYYDFAFGGLFTVTSVGQDANVLPPSPPTFPDPIEDPKYTAFQFHNCNDCIFDVFLFDATGTGAHNGNNYAISGDNVTIKGRLLKQFLYEEIELYGVESLNRYAIVKDPTGLVLSNNTGYISQFDNAIAFAGNEDKVSYLGYKAVGPHFFNGGFSNPASTYGPADVAPSANVTIYNGEDLLTNSPISDRASHSIANVAERELYFAEIVIDDLENMQTFGDSPIKQLLLSLGGAKINAIECILHFSTGTPHHRKIDPDSSEFLAGGLFNLFGYRYAPNKNDALRMIIIRLIGQAGSDTDRVYVNDIGVQTKEVSNKPNVNIGGNQTIYGEHTIAEQLRADEFGYTGKSSSDQAGKVLQVKKDSEGAIGLYKLNTNDLVDGTSYGSNSNLGDNICQFTSVIEITPEAGTIDVIYRFVNLPGNANEYTTKLFANGVEQSGSTVVKTIRGAENKISISMPVTATYPVGTVFHFTVESARGGVIGGASFASQLRIRQSYLVPKPGVAVPNVTGATIAGNEAKINELLTTLRNAGFIMP